MIRSRAKVSSGASIANPITGGPNRNKRPLRRRVPRSRFTLLKVLFIFSLGFLFGIFFPSFSEKVEEKVEEHRANVAKKKSEISSLRKNPHEPVLAGKPIKRIVEVKKRGDNNVDKSKHKGLKGETSEKSKARKDDNVAKSNEMDIPVVESITTNGDRARKLPPRSNRPLGRGVSGLPMDQTPALVGAKRGHIECDVDVDELAYWNSPQGDRDLNFKSPFVTPSSSGKTKYLSFEPDVGGWNNIRMNLEIVFVYALVTGRTLVMPPSNNVYLLDVDKSNPNRGFADFYPFNTPEFKKRIPWITTEEFVRREGGEGGRFPIPEMLIDEEVVDRSYANITREDVINSSKECERRAKSDVACDHVYWYLRGVAFLPQFNQTHCIIFDEEKFTTGQVSPSNDAKVREFCHPRLEKNMIYIDKEFESADLIHFRSGLPWRMFAHFYGYLYFTNPSIYNYAKRFVRDYLRYHDSIYCAAGKIVLALQEEGKKLGFSIDDEGGGGYASLHVRRGDLQFPQVKISGQEWHDNLNETWKANEIIYIATDERNKTFFDPIAEKYKVKFLDDYWDYAKLGELDGNYMGMIDTIVASRGRTFAGTFFSTFSGYINRMRGYHGMSMKDSYHSWLDRKNVTHTWEKHYDGIKYSWEWPDGWVGIDGDVEPSREKF